MKKTMLTVRTLDRFEREYKTEHYTPEQIETIEHATYVANMNQCNNPDWTESDIFADFLRVLNVHKIETETAEADETETENENEQEETKMFENIIKAIAEAAREQSAKFFAHMETCTTIGALRNDSYVRQYTTPKQCERLLAMDDSEAIPNKDFTKIMDKYTATIQKRQKAAIDKMYAAEAAEMPKNIALHITWTRNNTWGWNPHVECTVDYKSNTYGTASGCGYDKTSAAAAEALNASTAVLKALYTWVNEGGYTYGVNTPDRLHWISAPYFEGGCGMSTIRAAFEAMGYKCEDRTHYNRRGTEESRNVYFYKD